MLFSKKKKPLLLDPERIPVHVAAIMDGNGRWAQKRGLPRTAGHSAGSETFQRAAEHLSDLGVKYFTVYAFSTENWKRPPEEVGEIIRLLEKYLRRAIREMREKNIRLRFFGDLSPIPENLRALIEETDAISQTTGGMQVNVCLNYGGRAELTRAARLLAEDCKAGRLNSSDITEEAVSARLYSADIPDPDLMIRPGGEMRLSNFLLWQNAYTEFYFTDVLWP
ncbi:MAG: di-trans,poly-cis-decaprenylcistransferase, partial [Clostridia bacterium]|nr:di-trans,poly-cis-decaprenylcistransferase [Clostridia bacterium]